MKKFKITSLFIRSNFRKSISSILTLTTFLLVLNILLGILFSTTGIFSNSITENSSVHFMEIINNGDNSDLSKIKKYLDEISDVKGSFIDVSHPVMIECNNDSGMEIYTLVGVPKELLPDIGLSSDNEEFLFLPGKDKNKFNGLSNVQFEETLYKEQSSGIRKSEIVYFKYNISGFYRKISWDLFPDNIIIIDVGTATEIANRMTEDENILPSDRIIASIKNVSKMENIDEELSLKFPNTDIRYALKFTGQLPQFATVLIAISGIIVIILLVFCFVNIRSSVRQILDQRSRDIGLLSLFGVKTKEILSIFVMEFLFNGIIAFIFSSFISTLMFSLFKLLFDIDLLTGYLGIYLLSNVIIAVLLFVIIAFVQVSSSLKRINNAKVFKEILK